MYYRMTGKGHDEMVEEAKPDARQALEREAVLAAIIEAEGIEPSDGDVLDVLTAEAARVGSKPEKLRKRLEQNGRLQDVKDDLAQRQAVDLIVESAKPA
jgi:trigger factor